MATEVYAEKLATIKDEAGLSRQDVAQIVGSSPRTVLRWATGQSVPRGLARERLLELVVISQLVARVMKPEAVSAWIFAPNPFLDYAKPVDLIAKGRYRDVIGAVEALGEGVFV